MAVTTATFVPTPIDPADWAQLEPLYQVLLARPITTAEQLQRWLLDFSELSARVSEYGSRCNIDKSCHTDDPEIEKRFLHYVENIAPKIKPLHFELEKKFLACPHRDGLTDAKYFVLTREWNSDVALFRQENVPLQTELTKLANDYDNVCGAMLVNFRSTQYTLQQLARFGEDPDRTTRQAAWAAAETRRGADRQKLDDLFDQMLALRARVATNAGCPDFRAYMWQSYCRFDYTPDDCLRFADAIEQVVLPLVDLLNQDRCAAMGLTKLRPWDLAVDPRGRPALRPFAQERIDEFVAKTGAIFDRISPELAAGFRELEPGQNLDLDSRKGKRPGGYQSSLEVVRQPFIFMNAVGLQRDVETLLHEAGHAFHYQQARHEPLVFLRHAPLEFCEVASMAMELLGDDHLEVFYNSHGVPGSDAARAKRVHLEGIVRIFPWIATIDLFQHWLYTHPGHTQAQRAETWRNIHRRFTSKLMDWSGYEDIRDTLWQRQLHLFHYPFYYVEYGIAQLGALQVWRRYAQAPVPALADLQRALALGGTRPLPELFRTAGIRFEFTKATLVPLREAIEKELARLPV